MATYRSFAEQALYYFDRAHESVRRFPIECAAAWRGDEVRGGDDWKYTFTDGDIAEIEAAVAGVRGSDLGAIDRRRFPLPELSRRISGWSDELARGRGFLLLRGLPVERWGEADASLAYWGIGQHLGTPGGQNPDEELLGHVRDMGEESSDPYVRRYRTAGDIAYHCDLADVVGLLCLQPALSGGASRIVSSVSVFNEVARRRPDLVGRLFEPFCLDTRNDSGTPFVPVTPCAHAKWRVAHVLPQRLFPLGITSCRSSGVQRGGARVARSLRRGRTRPEFVSRYELRRWRHSVDLQSLHPARAHRL